MKVNGNTAPASAFTVEKNGDKAFVRFFENVTEVIREGEKGYEWDEYRLERDWYESIESDIESNYGTWFSQAKLVDEQMNPPDSNQMRADLDYVMAMEGL